MILTCIKCDLCLTRMQIVNGSGNIYSELMFIGEAPGYTEDKYGIPFIGKAGAVLTNYINLFGFDRKKIYITNVIKCRPPNNRKPLQIEIDNCKEHILKEITEVNPKIIVLLGNTALEFLLNKIGISKYRGVWHNIGNKHILPMFHPSYLIPTKEDNKVKEKTLTYYDFLSLTDKYKQLIDSRHNTNF